MKMSKELYNELSKSIELVISQNGRDVIVKQRKAVKFTKSQFVAFCWSMFHATNMEYRKFYDADLNDSHIETALKRILSDFA